MDRLKRERKSLRMVFTKTVNKIIDLLSTENPDETLLEGYSETLKECYDKIEYFDHQVVDHLFEEEANDDTVELEYSEIEEYKLKFKCTKIKLNKFLYKPDESDGISVSHVSQINVDGNSRISNNFSQVNEVSSKITKYPKISLKKFDGDLKEWLSFWAQFKNVHNNSLIPIADKFQYLVQCMVKGSKAQILVGSYPQSDENYPKVIEALQKRFGRDDLLIEVYIRELLKLVIKNNSNKSVSLKLSSMFDSLESHLRALESLGITSDKYDCMLYPLVESSLPEDVLRAWQRSGSHRESGVDKSKLDVLMEFLRNEVEAEEKINLAKDGFGLSSKASSRRKQDETSIQEGLCTAAGLHVSSSKNSNKCLFCNGNHDPDRCVKAQTMQFSEKKQRINSKKVCSLCFAAGHMARACKAVIRCNICGRKHYVVMCPDSPNNKEGPKDENESAVREAEPNSLQETETNVTMSCHGGHLLLQTILVKAVGTCGKKIVRLMLDSGAQRSYISDKSVADLGAQVVGEEHLDQITFGGNKSGPIKHSLYNITLEDLTGKNKLNIQVLNQKVICGEIPKLQKGPWLKELSVNGIWINDMDPKYNKIDILIGADLYGQIVTGRTRKLENGVLAVETIFGWTLLGRLQGEPSLAWTVTNLLLSGASVTDLWSLETLDPAESLNKAEKEEYSNEHFKKTVKFNTFDIKPVRRVYWTTALSWIQRDQVWNTFVRKRISEILKFSARDSWRYLPSASNPADLPSRGCGPPKLMDSRWREGPRWLREPEHCWPNEVFQVEEQAIEEEISKSKFAVDRIEWKFSPPTAAWWSEWWERLIRVVKQLLIRMLARALLDYEELSTLLCNVEAVVNSRPLIYVSEDSQELTPLTPRMFLQETRTNVYDLDEIEKVGFERRYRYRHRLREDFRQRFRIEYLSELVQKLKVVNEAVKIGDVVLTDTGDKRRLQWPLGRVVDVYPGQDGHVRVVRLKTKTGELVRPIQRVYLMEAKGCTDMSERRPEERREDEKLTVAEEENKITVTRSGRTVKPPKRYGNRE